MDEELKKMLEKTLALVEDNNKMLKKVRRVQKWANYSRLFYIILIIGSAVLSYYFTKPFLEKALGTYNSTSSGFSEILNRFGGKPKE